MTKIFFAFLFVISAFSAQATDFPDESLFKSLLSINSDSGIKGPPYQKIVDEMKDGRRRKRSDGQKRRNQWGSNGSEVKETIIGKEKD